MNSQSTTTISFIHELLTIDRFWKRGNTVFQLSIHCEVQDFYTMTKHAVLVNFSNHKTIKQTQFDKFAGRKEKDMRDREVKTRVTRMHCIICETLKQI